MEKDPDGFPMRINKYLAHKQVATRRAADALISKKRVLINGRTAVLGDKVNLGDKITLQKGFKREESKYFAYNKAKGVLTTGAQNQEEIEIIKKIPLKGVFPVGRLDKDSHGLIILTNDGRITDPLLNPENDHEKEYIVKTRDPLRNNFKEKIEAGLNIEGYMTKPCKVKVISEKVFKITLTEGKKHQIRRMVVALFNDVVDLKRTRIQNINLGDLKVNQYREIVGEEKDEFLKSLGFTNY
jgi:23S rRNA pseudouridine2604 synthase